MVHENGLIGVSFLAGRARVAPMKPLTIPRLELQAALIGSRLAETIGSEIDCKLDQRYFWSDAMTVLHWIQGDPRAYQTYVSHRITEIHELTKVDEWN